jgi:hypothetical protein
VGFIEENLKERVAEGLDGVRLFGTILSRWDIPLAKRTTKMWEYSGHMDPDYKNEFKRNRSDKVT